MPTSKTTDQEGNGSGSRFHEIKEIIRKACCNEAGDLRTRFEHDAEPFNTPQEREDFFSKYASLLLDYEKRSRDEVEKRLLNEEKDDIEYRVLTASQHLKSLGASDETIASTANSLRQDLEKRIGETVAHDEEVHQELHRSKEKEQIKQVSIEARNMILCDIRIIYLDLSPLKKNSPIAYSMSRAFSALGLFPDDPETIREILIDNCATDFSV